MASAYLFKTISVTTTTNSSLAMWERTLQDLIRGLRANKKDETKFITQAVGEIRQEIKSRDMELKAAAVLKLTYLDMLGYDMSWASFHVVEVMSSAKIHLKAIGYLAAAQSFGSETDVLMLTTNLVKKDLASNPADVAVALNGLSDIVTSDLARDLSPDLIAMLNHSRPHIRKRAVIALYRVFLKYPEARPAGIIRMREKLNDPDESVLSTTMNVLCELTGRNPSEYLVLAPQLFHILTTSQNNWMLIKTVKLFGTLCPHEPRLVKKLQSPITDIISSTPAISLLYECVRTCITGGMLQGSQGRSLAKTCVDKLATFLQDQDQNLKYIALLALVKIVPSHPHLVAEYQEMILASVNDQDISIRMRALDLLSAMVDRNNLQSIVQQVLSHLAPSDTSSANAIQSLSQHISQSGSAPPAPPPSQSSSYRLILVQRILTACSQNTYENVLDFEWYISVLVDLAYISDVDVGTQIRDHLIDVVGRVQGVRRFAVQLMAKLLRDDSFLLNAKQPGSCVEVLFAAAFICGEHCQQIPDYQSLILPLLSEEMSRLPADIVAVYIQSAMKIFSRWAVELAERWDEDDLPAVKDVACTIIARLSVLNASPHIEVQERASNALQLFNFITNDLANHRPRPDSSSGSVFSSSFGQDSSVAEPHFPKSLYLIEPLLESYDLRPVARAAQESVPIPDGLDLDAWIVPPPPKAADIIAKDKSSAKVKKSKKGKEKDDGKRRSKQPTDDIEVTEEQRKEQEERARLKAERLERLRDDPYYIIDDKPLKHTPSAADDIDSIPIVKLDDLPVASGQTSRVPLSIGRSSANTSAAAATPKSYTVEVEGEMPTNARSNAAIPSTPAPAQVHQPPSRRQTPVPYPPVSASALAPVISSFPPYEGADVDVQPATPTTSAPEPIKVVRASKKKRNKAEKDDIGSGSTKTKSSSRRAKAVVVDLPSSAPAGE